MEGLKKKFDIFETFYNRALVYLKNVSKLLRKGLSKEHKKLFVDKKNFS